MNQTSDECGITSLPPEVMVTIFEFLTFHQLRAVSLTCKRWYHLALSPKFSRKMRINFGKNGAAFENVLAIRNYRNACVQTDLFFGNDSAMAEFFKVAPLETLMICGLPETINSLLGDHLLSMKDLTTLEVKSYMASGTVLRISHPSLKSLNIRYPGNAFKINCPSLTSLNITSLDHAGSKTSIQPVVQLQHQLQSLDIDISEMEQLEMLANAKLNNLKSLQLRVNIFRFNDESLFNRMVNLVELHLHGFYGTLGEELGVLKKLSKLKLDSTTIDTSAFEKALGKMEALKDLDLDGCRVKSLTQSWHISSERFRNLSVKWVLDYPMSLPNCTHLKSLKLFRSNRNIDDNFVQVCNSYPLLEKLHVGAELRYSSLSASSFAHIAQLKLLRELLLDGLFLENLDWTAAMMELEKLRLNNCEIRGIKDQQQWIESLGGGSTGLQQLTLSFCNKTGGETFEIDEKVVVALRRVLPRCRIACDYSQRRGTKRGRAVEYETGRF